MKKLFLLGFLTLALLADISAQQYEYSIVTSIESIVPMGLGRSRIIQNTDSLNVKDYTTIRTDGKGSDQGSVKRSDAKIDKMEETKLLNFYSGVGINFQNVASNDAMMTSKLNNMSQEGWELAFVISGVESKGSKDDKQGLFITRYVFKRIKK